MTALRKGGKGPAVVYLQQCLNTHGHHVLIDGVFGEKTEDAVEQFQSANGLLPDGIVGPRTWDALRVTWRQSVPTDLVREQQRELSARFVAPLDQEILLTPHRMLRVGFLRRAIADLGKKEVPPGSNSGPEIEHLVGDYPVARRTKPGQAWCLIGLSRWLFDTYTTFAEGGIDPKVHASWKITPFQAWFGNVMGELVPWAKDKGCWYGPEAKIEPASILVMRREKSGSDAGKGTTVGHVAAALGPEDEGTRTVECNVSNGVGSLVREVEEDAILGSVRWWEASR